MKTTVYKVEKRMISLILVVLISTICTAATKGNEIPAANTGKNSGAGKLTLNATSAGTKVESLTATLQDWMESGSYWATEDVREVSNDQFINELEQWMKKGSYWSGEATDSLKKENKISSTLKKWMVSGSYWRNAGDNK